MFEFQANNGLEIINELVYNEPNFSRIYGFILYTEGDPYVVKVLRDNDFWNSLNMISGSSWPIFSVRPLKSDQMGYKYKDNLPIFRDFGINNTQELPLFIVFIWNDKNELQKIMVPIEGQDVDSVYHSLEKIVKTISNVETKVKPELKRSELVFKNVSKALKEQEGFKISTSLLKGGKIVMRMIEFFSVFL